MRSTSVFSSKPRRKKDETTTITFALLKEDRDEVAIVADSLGLSVSGLCREALQVYIQSKLQNSSDSLDGESR